MKFSKNCRMRNQSATGKTLNFQCKPILFSLLILIVTFLIGCASADSENKEKSAAIADSLKSSFPEIATDTINGLTHNFIRTAELKFKVVSVLNTSQKIEDLVSARGGYVSENEMQSEVESSYSVKVSKDSIKEIKRYTMFNDLIVKVPNKQLDTVLRQLSNMAIYFDYSKLKSDDVKLKLYSNKLAENRYAKFNNKVEEKLSNSAPDIKKTMLAEEKILNAQTQKDETEIASFELADQVNYSTVRIHIYQAPTTFSQLIPLAPEIEPYEAPFFQKAGIAFTKGFDSLLTFILFIINSWGVLLILFGLFLVARKGYKYLVSK